MPDSEAARADALIALLAGRRGHFQMESGYHSDQWFTLDRLFDEPARLRPFVRELARRLAAHRVDFICGPQTGGAKLAQLLARELNVEAIAVERIAAAAATKLFPVRYELPVAAREKVRGHRVAIVDDAISAGSAARGTQADAAACGARPVALGALFVFGHKADAFAREHQLALEALARLDFNLWLPTECPLCQRGMAVEKISDAV